MRVILRVVAILAIPVALIGAFLIAVAGSGLYMVTIGGVAPGDPMWSDELAPSIRDATVDIVRGAVLVAGSLLVRALVRRELRLPGEQP